MADACWQLPAEPTLPLDFKAAVGTYIADSAGHYAAQLLWQRGICDRSQLAEFLEPDCYQPTSAFAWGDEMSAAMQRLTTAYKSQECVAIWGDFDADGITATAVLWDGLGQFFSKGDRLTYVIPNRLTESHGLSAHGIDALAEAGVQLIVTCDTGCNNLSELTYAQSLGLDVIITDHHTLPQQRPDCVAMINPRCFPSDHPLAHLSGVAVAYKLIEALYESLPQIPHKPLEHLLDLVAIGLIADLVELKGDCRYLAQKGIRQLQSQTQMHPPTRPGIAELLSLCRKTGDRPTDISFGIGPRINAVSRIYGDARFCVDLLTSTDPQRCRQLAEETELANSRRKALQRDVAYQVTQKLTEVDLSTTHVIVLADPQWPVGVLGLVAGQIAQDYARPTILLTLQPDENVEASSDETASDAHPRLAKGSARSLRHIDLYDLVKSQSHLLRSFGGHPLAAGLSLAANQVPIFADAINQEFRLRYGSAIAHQPTIQADLVVSVAELGQSLFRELKLLEPYGMGNPTPRLLIQNCWFENTWHRKITDARNHKIEYIRATFEIWDHTVSSGFPGVWWGHYKDDIPAGQCDAIVELDYTSAAPSSSSLNGSRSAYQVRLVDVRSHQNASPLTAFTLEHTATSDAFNSQHPKSWLLDWRSPAKTPQPSATIHTVATPPAAWQDFFDAIAQAQHQQVQLAIAYPPPPELSPEETWQQLVGIAKYLNRTQKSIVFQQLTQQLHISDRTLHFGLCALSQMGFRIVACDDMMHIAYASDAHSAISSSTHSNNVASDTFDQAAKVTHPPTGLPTGLPASAIDSQSDEQTCAQSATIAIQIFLTAVGEERFRQRYFYEAPISRLEAIAHQFLYQSRSQSASHSH